MVVGVVLGKINEKVFHLIYYESKKTGCNSSQLHSDREKNVSLGLCFLQVQILPGMD